MALLLTLLSGWPAGPWVKEKTLASGLGGKLGPWEQVPRHPLAHLDGCGRRRCESHGSEREDSCLLQPQLNTRPGAHVPVPLAGGWQD